MAPTLPYLIPKWAGRVRTAVFINEQTSAIHHYRTGFWLPGSLSASGPACGYIGIHIRIRSGRPVWSVKKLYESAKHAVSFRMLPPGVARLHIVRFGRCRVWRRESILVRLVRFFSLVFCLERGRRFHGYRLGRLLFRHCNACMAQATQGGEHATVYRRADRDMPEAKSFMRFFHIKAAISAPGSSGGEIFLHIAVGSAWRIGAVKDPDHLAKKSLVFRGGVGA